MPAGTLVMSLALLAQETGQGAASGPESGGASFPWILVVVGALLVVLLLAALLRRLR